MNRLIDSGFIAALGISICAFVYAFFLRKNKNPHAYLRLTGSIPLMMYELGAWCTKKHALQSNRKGERPMEGA